MNLFSLSCIAKKNKKYIRKYDAKTSCSTQNEIYVIQKNLKLTGCDKQESDYKKTFG